MLKYIYTKDKYTFIRFAVVYALQKEQCRRYLGHQVHHPAQNWMPINFLRIYEDCKNNTDQTLAVRETGVSLIMMLQLRAPLKPLNTIVL